MGRQVARFYARGRQQPRKDGQREFHAREELGG
jgi:hypothetical protein